MPANLPASVRQRLLNHSRQTGDEPNLIWTRYAVERLLYRLSISPHGDGFVLKGAMLFAAWTNRPYRPTRDVDLLGFGDASPARLTHVFADLCRIKCEPDGLKFDAGSIEVSAIREEQEYQGQRVTLVAYLDTVRIHVQVDIGFGDAITPAPTIIAYPTLLDFPPPRIKAYPKETVVAEKLHAMVSRGMENSRMKDFFDLRLLAQEFQFEGRLLTNAIRSTFERRGTPLPASLPLALSDDFASDAVKQTQWNAFLRKGSLSPVSLAEVLSALRPFLWPPLTNAVNDMVWENGGPWR
jgi:hypothetical protein